MSFLKYVKIVTENDTDVPYLVETYNKPEISRFLCIGDNYFRYVTSTEDVCFYKVYAEDSFIGAIHLEKQDTVLFMSILVFSDFQRKGFGKIILKDIQNDVFGLHYDSVEVSVDEKNYASLALFKSAGFVKVSQEDELVNFVYRKQ